MTTMIERMAGAMRAQTAKELDMVAEFGPWANATDDNRRQWIDCARAALKAMREPTTGMERAGLLAAGGDGSVLDGWDAMIEAALAGV